MYECGNGVLRSLMCKVFPVFMFNSWLSLSAVLLIHAGVLRAALSVLLAGASLVPQEGGIHV